MRAFGDYFTDLRIALNQRMGSFVDEFYEYNWNSDDHSILERYYRAANDIIYRINTIEIPHLHNVFFRHTISYLTELFQRVSILFMVLTIFFAKCLQSMKICFWICDVEACNFSTILISLLWLYGYCFISNSKYRVFMIINDTSVFP